MKAGSATAASSRNNSPVTPAESAQATPERSFAASLARTLAPVFETVVHVDVPAQAAERRGRDRTEGEAPRDVEPTEKRDASAGSLVAGAESFKPGPDVAELESAESNRVELGLGTSVEENISLASPAGEAERRPIADGQSAGKSSCGSHAGSDSDSPDEKRPGGDSQGVSVARDPLGLMPQNEAVDETASEVTDRDAEPTLFDQRDQRRAQPRAQASEMEAGAQDLSRAGGAPSGQNGAVSSSMTVAMSGAPSASSPPVSRPSGAGQVNSMNGLGGLSGAGRGGIWRLEHTAKPQSLAGKADPESQVARAMVAALRHKGGVVTLRLSPDDLGPVRVELRVEDGRVSATIDAQHDRARGALLGGLESLRKSLEASGLTIDRLEVVGSAGLGTSLLEGSPRQKDQEQQQWPQQEGHGQEPHSQGWGGSGGQRGQDGEFGEEPSEAPPGTDSADLAWSLRTLRLDTVV